MYIDKETEQTQDERRRRRRKIILWL